MLKALTEHDQWRIDAPGGDPFSFLARILRCDFIDIVRAGREYQRTVIVEGDGADENGNGAEHPLRAEDDFTTADAAVLVRKLHLLLGDDEELKEYVTVLLMRNLSKREDVACALGVSEQEVTNRKRRFAYKLKPWVRLFVAPQTGRKKKYG